MSAELSHSQTEPEAFTHPVKIFLHELGIDTTLFPNVRFLLETSEKDIRVGRFSMPLRLPSQPGYVYDSVARITRILEVPATAQKAHRKFIEIEWQISEEASIDENNHAVLSFLAAQVECADCKEIFIPDPEVINESSVRLSCPNCLNYWSVSVSSSTKKSESPELLFDAYAKDPAKLRNLISRWIEGPIANHDQNYFLHFPFHFDTWDQGSSLDWLFGESTGWTALSNGELKDFESLFKGFLNSLALEHFRNEFAKRPLSQLDQTEVQRKPIAEKTENPELPPDSDPEKTPVNIKAKPALDQRFVWQSPITAVREAPKLPPPPKSKSGISGGTWLFSLGAFGVVGIIFGGIYFSQNIQAPRAQVPSTPAASISTSVAVEIPQAEIPQAEAPKPEPKSQKIEAPPAPIPPLPRVVEKVKPAETAKQKRARDLAIDSSFRQGMLHLKLQQSQQAIGEFQKVLALDPNHADAQRGLGLAYVYEQNFQEAIIALNKYLKLAGNAYDKSSIEELLATLRSR